MVRRVAEDGGVWHESPYTEEEERDLDYHLSCAPIQVMHGSRTIPQNRKPQRRQNSAGLHREFEPVDPSLALTDDLAGVLDILAGGALSTRIVLIPFELGQRGAHETIRRLNFARCPAVASKYLKLGAGPKTLRARSRR